MGPQRFQGAAVSYRRPPPSLDDRDACLRHARYTTLPVRVVAAQRCGPTVGRPLGRPRCCRGAGLLGSGSRWRWLGALMAFGRTSRHIRVRESPLPASLRGRGSGRHGGRGAPRACQPATPTPPRQGQGCAASRTRISSISWPISPLAPRWRRLGPCSGIQDEHSPRGPGEGDIGTRTEIVAGQAVVMSAAEVLRACVGAGRSLHGGRLAKARPSVCRNGGPPRSYQIYVEHVRLRAPERSGFDTRIAPPAFHRLAVPSGRGRRLVAIRIMARRAVSSWAADTAREHNQPKRTRIDGLRTAKRRRPPG